MWNIDDKILKITEYSGVKEPSFTISGSSAGAPILQKYLRVKHGIAEQEVVGANTLGSLVHIGLEQLGKLDTFDTEIPFEYKLDKDGSRLSCTIDIIDHEAKVIADVKVTKRYTYENIAKNKAYIDQILFNKQLAEQTDPKYKDYKTYLILILKDYESNFKKEEIDMIQYIEIFNNDIDYIERESIALYDIRSHLGTGSFPQKCEDLWWRNVKGVKTPMRCIKYCSYKEVCPHYEEPYIPTDQVAHRW